MDVLAIDGGGIRGLIPALVLAEIESRTGRRIADLVDMIAGTSTGGILGCALGKPDPLPAAEIAAIYEEEGPKIFDRSLLKRITSLGGYRDERYSSDGLVSALERYLGDTAMSEATLPLLLTAYDTEARAIHLLRSEGEHSDASMVDAAHATSAAPTYFEPVRLGRATLIDGGVFATNPALVAYAEVRGKLDLLLSLGTGEHTRPLPYEKIKDWGQLEWARPVIDVVFDGGQDAVDLQLGALLPDGYVRLQTQLEKASDDLDDASEDNLQRLREEAEELIATETDTIDEVCARLTA
ncbi:MAG TPA: patatin-like phospholipase family protein [Solirubrobacteraceae bacterium]|nr:patatin-like phospholipase family protein [Solirubrobacteraceae bacterium]